MARRIQTTKRFNIKVSRVYDYVTVNWGVKTADNFRKKLVNRVLQMQQHPGIGRPSSKKPHIRRVLVGKQNILYYSNKRSRLYLHNMFSSYSDPNKNPYG
jgi:plasmid stabilization system protein ParE